MVVVCHRLVFCVHTVLGICVVGRRVVATQIIFSEVKNTEPETGRDTGEPGNDDSVKDPVGDP